jgi:hypothetical protein
VVEEPFLLWREMLLTYVPIHVACISDSSQAKNCIVHAYDFGKKSFFLTKF